jgi:hypothetical protein
MARRRAPACHDGRGAMDRAVAGTLLDGLDEAIDEDA